MSYLFSIPPQAALFESMDVYIQLDTKTSRIVKFNAAISESTDETGQGYWFIKKQFLKLEPFEGESGGVGAILKGVTDEQLRKAFSFASSKTDAELLKDYGPNAESFLSCVVLKMSNAEIFAVTKRMLASSDPAVRDRILAKSSVGYNAFKWSCYHNKAEVSR